MKKQKRAQKEGPVAPVAPQSPRPIEGRLPQQAQQFLLKHGGPKGMHLSDWLQLEKELGRGSEQQSSDIESFGGPRE